MPSSNEPPQSPPRHRDSHGNPPIWKPERPKCKLPKSSWGRRVRNSNARTATFRPDVGGDRAARRSNRAVIARLAEARETAATSTAAASELRQTVEELRQSHERLRESTGISEQRHGELQHKHELLQQQYQELRRSQQESTESKAQSAADWEAERSALVARAAQAEHQLSQIDPRQLEDSQRRFEMAIADVRDLKRRNAELEEQLIALRAAGVASAPRQLDNDVSPDWEATKRRMLESLEADNGQEADTISAEQRLTVESTIQITDQIVAAKDRELMELRMHLSQQSSNIGSVAVGAAAIAENFDRDELIQQEREKLRVLQEEWRDKLRQAEIDISIERARIARQRVEIEEKVSAYDSVASPAHHGRQRRQARRPAKATHPRPLARPPGIERRRRVRKIRQRSSVVIFVYRCQRGPKAPAASALPLTSTGV